MTSKAASLKVENWSNFLFKLIDCFAGHSFLRKRIPLINDSLTEEMFSTVSDSSMFIQFYGVSSCVATNIDLEEGFE